MTVVGGASAASEAWLSLKAQVLPWPLRLVTAAEPVPAGAALVAAARAGVVGAPVPGLGSIPVPRSAYAAGEYDGVPARFVEAATGS